ncbi:hypothetical protein AB4455_05895 [Vibrio sp. 10N.261.46.E12]|uniref:hypothetical protein n=1 Tax=unclassified Vibrio TaxID=2614977 RepID=UPI0009787FB4|nr:MULTISPECIES: hypothetical protein [unclassified Vibrio]OMO35064.1 hypothetical protein BH584_10655 [Vibrio sp. 10N.261.45.E1]PMJ36243.1 hypothetical protein BCU27_23315 [Vibrio sp. 10N.286.45.B6]PML96132.1 hypothetical protein BCT66_22270 [Vibrio sp. 10N.261.49.E11]PMM68419.1 hypothetical protein BCT48_11680 [Vibrio sp. 10N.261.46.F12]PMM80281.1 hypothetical protein BCT46_18330 [Vibrio sp. 10N.261.46.E8]
MKLSKFKAISSITMGLLLSTSAYAQSHKINHEDTIEFSDPTVVYSSAEVAYGTEGATLGLGLAAPVNDNWAALVKYEAKEDLQLHRLRAATSNTNVGTGFMLDYIWDTDFADVGADSHTLVINALQVLPIGDNALFVPLLGAGFTSNDLSDNKAYIGMAQAMVVYNFSPDVWMNLIPQYTYGFNTFEMNLGDGVDIRKFEFESVLGYRFNGNQNIRLMYKYNDDKDHEGTLSYTYAF